MRRPPRPAEGVRFETAHAHNVVTLPSHANLLSGRYPLRHGVRDNAGFRFPADGPTLATLLTGGAIAPGPSSAPSRSTRASASIAGFDVYDDRSGGDDGRRLRHARERPGTETVRRGAGVDEPAAAALVRLGPPLRAALPLRAARRRSPRASPPTPTRARWRRPTPRWGRSSSRLLGRRRDGRRARRLDRRPRRVAGRARRGDARHLRLRGDAARAARALRAGPCPRGPSGARAGAARRRRPHRARCPGAARRPPTCRAAACCRRRGRRGHAAPELLRGPAACWTGAGRRSTGS